MVESFAYLPPANEVCEGYVFTGVCLSMGGHAWLLWGGHVWLLMGGMRGCSWGGGACVVAPGGVHAGGCACLGGRGVGMHGEGGACMAKGGVCGKGGMCGEGGHAWQKGGVHGKGGACMAKGGMHGKGGCAWQKGGHAWYEIRPIIARVVRILLECILVHKEWMSLG